MELYWVFEYKPIASEILTQLRRCKRAYNKLMADEKGPHHFTWARWLSGLYINTFIHLLT